MKIVTKNLICLFLMWVAAVNCFAAPYTFRGLTMTEGLSDLLVNTIYKDVWGCVWFGTSNSVDRFDGVEVRHYTFDHADTKMKRVNAITGSLHSRLWVGNNIGLWTLDNETDKLIQVGMGKLECPVYSLLFDGKKTLYIGTEKGLFLYTDEDIQEILLDKNVFSKGNQVKGMCLDGQGNLWLATPLGLYSYQIKNHKINFYKDTSGNASLFRQVVYLKGKLYLGTEKQGLYEFDLHTRKFTPYLPVGSNIISSLSTDGIDKLYVGTDGGGVSFISTQRRQVVHTITHDVNDRASIRSNSVYSLLVDKEGIVWIGYYQSGVDYSLYQSGLFDIYHWGAFTTQNMAVRSFSIVGPYKVIGTRDGLYFVDEQRNVVRSYHADQLRSNLIFSIFYYQQEFYIGTYNGGLWILNPETGNVRRMESSYHVFSSGTIFSMCRDTQENLWLATSVGVYCYSPKGKRIIEYTSKNSQLPEGQVYALYFDSRQNGWFATEGGLAVFDPSSNAIKTNVFPDGFANREVIRSIYEDRRHQLYFVPDKGALFVSSIDMKRTSRIPLYPAVQSTACMSVVEDTKGMLWLGCDNGLLSLFPSSQDGSYSIYGFNDGLLSSVFSYGASFKDSSGTLWFGTGKGLVFLNNKRLNVVNRNPYPVSITDIYINGAPLTPEMRQYERDNGFFSLTAAQKNLEFHFSSRNFTDPLSMGFEYKLDGVDEDWKVIVGNNRVTYYDLSGGDYVFHVRMIGDPTNEKMYKLHIAYSVSAWIWIVLCLVIIILFLLFVRRKIQNRQVTDSVETPESGLVALVGEEKSGEEKYKTNRLSEAECSMLADKLTTLMEQEHPYTRPDLKIGDLAQLLSSTSHALSYLFNQYLQQSYYDYINELRVRKFKELANSKEYSKYTLDALAELCGFSSRATFFRSFKKSTGVTPNEYLNSIK